VLAPALMLFAGGASTGVLLCLLTLTLFQRLRVRTNVLTQSRPFAAASQAAHPSQRKHPSVQWLHVLLRRSALFLALLLAYGLFASFASAQTTLQRVDPVVFSALQLSLLLPLGLGILGLSVRTSARGSIRLGFIGGFPLGIGFVGVALSLHALGIIPTAMLTALDGLMASLMSWLVFRQHLSMYTCLATICASGGAILLWWVAPSQWQPDLVALACGLAFTLYAFHVERHLGVLEAFRQQLLPFFGGLFCSMAITALALALCFGKWGGVQAMTLGDLEVLLYCGLATVLIPQVILTILLRHIGAVTLAFFAVLEPLISLGFAYWWGKISLNLFGWCGVILILLSIILQAYASRRPTSSTQTPSEASESESAHS